MTLVATQVKRRRGTGAENDAFTGAEGEITVDLTNKELRVHTGDNKVGGYGLARKDFENIEDEAKNIANWSSNVSNCITEIPQNIKLEFNSSTKVLTLKAGSKLYVPNGSGVFDTITIDSDKTLTNSFSGQYNNIFVFFDVANNTFRQTPTVNSGSSDLSSVQNRIWYDTTNNKIKYYENSGTTVTSDRVSFPFCIMANAGSGNGFTKIVQEFQGFGYIGTTTFVLPGVKALVPNGRNADGTCNNIELNFTTPTVHTLDYSNEVSKFGFLGANGIEGYGVYDYFEQDTEPVFSGIYATWYDTKNNIIKGTADGGATWTKYSRIYLGVLYKDANANITKLKTKAVFGALDYNDTEYMAHQTMPSDRYMNLTLPASGSAISAPADGYITFGKQNGTSSARFVRLSNNSNGLVVNSMVSYSSNSAFVTMPVKKGDIITIVYDCAETTNIFRFVYANGAE